VKTEIEDEQTIDAVWRRRGLHRADDNADRGIDGTAGIDWRAHALRGCAGRGVGEKANNVNLNAALRGGPLGHDIVGGMEIARSPTSTTWIG
jgi:hypothetical protein